jgi:hypothetical protein
VLRLEQGRSIEGTLEGMPSGSARLRVGVSGNGWFGSATADESGRFTIRGLPPGAYRVYASVPGGNARWEADGQVEAGAASVVLRPR